MEARRSGEGKRHTLVSRLAAQRGFAHRHECPTTCATSRQAMTSPQGRRADAMPSLQAIPQYRFSTAEIEPSRPRSVTHNRTVSVHAFMVHSCHDGDEYES